MNIQTKQKIQNFRKSWPNRFINIINVLLVIGSMFMLAFMLIVSIFTLGFVLETPRSRTIESPFSSNPIAVKQDVNTVYLDYLDNDELYYTITTTIKNDTVIELAVNDSYTSVISLFINDVEQFANLNNNYVIPVGQNMIVIDMKANVVIDKYNKYTLTRLEFDVDDSVSLSSEFRDVNLENREEGVELIYTKDSIGNYVPPFQRTLLYKGGMALLTGTVIYTVLNILKFVVLFGLTRGIKKNPS